LDLKEGAVVVSLKPFVKSVSSKSQITERNLDDMSSIFDVESREYWPGDVSWGNGGGRWWLHWVDRAGYRDVRERFERTRRAGEDSSRKFNGRRHRRKDDNDSDSDWDAS